MKTNFLKINFLVSIIFFLNKKKVIKVMKPIIVAAVGYTVSLLSLYNESFGIK